MMERQRRIAVSVMTWEALVLCLEENVSLLCIENPLYSQLYPNLPAEFLGDYHVDVFEEKQIILLTKVRGTNILDEKHFEPFYLPFSWDNWHS